MKSSLELMLYAILLLFTADVSGVITENPLNTVTEVGQQAIFNCTSSTTQQNWVFSAKREDLGTSSAQDIALSCVVHTGFITQYAVDRPGGSNNCNLIVKAATMQQAGVYTCTDSAPGTSAILTVIDSSPVITFNNTNDTWTAVEKESVIIECLLNHNGSVGPAPKLWPYFYWTNSSGNVSSSYFSTADNTAVSQITVKAGRQDIKPYTCHVYFQLMPPTTPNYASNIPTVSSIASSATIEVLYYPEITNLTSSVSIKDKCVHKQENLTCIADANPPAQYEWLDLSTNAMTPGAVKSITSGGQYRCIAYNYIRTMRYNATDNATEDNCYPVTENNMTITCTKDSCNCTGLQPLEITCEVYSLPKPTYLWLYNGFEYSSDQTFQVEFDGDYSCTANSSFGTNSSKATMSTRVFNCTAPPTTMLTTTQSTTKLSTVDPTTTPHNVTTTPSSVPIRALVGGIIIGSWFVANAIATPAFTGYYNAGTNDGSGHTKTKRNKTRLNKRFPWLQKMLPCLNDTKEGAGTNCLWVSLFILLGTFTGIVTFPICICLALKSEKNLERSALNRRENGEENGSAANVRRSVNSPHSPSQPVNQTKAANPYQNESREHIELNSSHHSRNLLLTDSPTSSTPPKGKPPPLPNKPAPNTPNTPGRAQNYVVTEPAAMDPNHTTYADLPFMPHVPPTRPVQYLDGTEDAYAELKKT